MSKREAIVRPQEELLGQSTPFHSTRLLVIYGILALAIFITALVFIQNNVMDTLQILLTAVTVGCIVFGVAKVFRDRRRQTLLYQTWFQCGQETYSYAEISQIEVHREQVSFRTGPGIAQKHSFWAGNADALAYLLRKKNKLAKQAASRRRTSSRSSGK